MLSKLTEKNKFDGNTWKIELDSLFHIYINETNTNSFLVEFKEWKFFYYKTHFTFISNDTIKLTIILTFDKVYDYFNSHPKYTWTQQQKENKLNRVLQMLPKSNIAELSMREKYNTLVNFFINLPTKIDIKEKINSISISFSNDNPTSSTLYTINENGGLLDLNYSQKNSMGYFFLHWEYPKDKNQNEIIDDYKNDLQKLSLQIQKKKFENLTNDFYGYNKNQDGFCMSCEFNKLSWEYDFDNKKVVFVFEDQFGKSKTIFRNSDFDFGSIILLDANKSINEIIEGTDIKSFYLLNIKGTAYFNYLDQIFIKGWSEEDFLYFQNKKEKLDVNSKQGEQDAEDGYKILPFLWQHLDFGFKIYSEYYSFSEKLIERYKDFINWEHLSSNENINWSESLIEKYKDNWNWDNLCSNTSIPWTKDFIHRNFDYISLISMTDNKKIPWDDYMFKNLENDSFGLNYACYAGNLPWNTEFLDKVSDMLNWDEFSTNIYVRWNSEILGKYSHKINWDEISKNPSLQITPELLMKFKSKFNMELLFQNQSFWINDTIREQYIDHIPWEIFSSFERIPWNEEFINNHKDKFNWDLMSANTSLPWSDDFYKKYYNLISLYHLSINHSFVWTEEFIEKNRDKFNWSKDYSGLSNNDGLPWSMPFIAKYIDLWEFGHIEESENSYTLFDGLGNRKTIPWSISLLDKFQNKWDYEVLLMNSTIWEKAFSKTNEALLRLFYDKFKSA